MSLPVFADSALVLFSGGQDSATCLAWALNRFSSVETLGFSYGQRHIVELSCREKIRTGLAQMNSNWASRLGEDHTLDLSVLGAISETALTRETDILLQEKGIPNTFVPGRNMLFLSFAATLAYRRGQRHIIGGMCETDYSGYPDCRDDTIKALQVALNLGMDQRFVLHTPLMWLDKADTWILAEQTGGDALVALINEHSHSCYKGVRDVHHAWGYGCGECPACELRRAGWQAYEERKQKK